MLPNPEAWRPPPVMRALWGLDQMGPGLSEEQPGAEVRGLNPRVFSEVLTLPAPATEVGVGVTYTRCPAHL